MDHLAARGINCPRPIHGRDGKALRTLAGKARRHHELPAGPVAAPHDGRAIAARSARRWPRCTWPAATSRSSGPTRCRSPAGGRCSRARAATSIAPLAAELDGRARFLRGQLARPACRRASSMPTCSTTTCSSCTTGCRGSSTSTSPATTAFAYDVAICLNAWCFEPDKSFNATKGRALLQGYDKRAAARAPTSARRCRCWRAARRCASC